MVIRRDVNYIPYQLGRDFLRCWEQQCWRCNTEIDTACCCSSLTGDKDTCNAPIENPSYTSEIDSEKSSSHNELIVKTHSLFKEETWVTYKW